MENENHSDIFGNAGINTMLVASIALRELYVSLRDAGFTEREACLVVADGVFGQRNGE